MAGVKRLICPTRPAKYFSAKGWTGFGVTVLICPSGYFVAGIYRCARTEAVHCAASEVAAW
jgi:hypothetical protein